jgi:hypothetical protein
MPVREAPAPKPPPMLSARFNIAARVGGWYPVRLEVLRRITGPQGNPHEPVISRRAIDRRLRAEWFITWSWFVTFLVPLSYLIWYQLQSASHRIVSMPPPEENVVFPALAGVSSSVGAIVAIFLPLTLHQFTVVNPIPEERPEDQFRRQWLTRLQRVTKWNVFMTIFVLLMNTVMVLLSIGKLDTFVSGMVRFTAQGFLVFGLTCFFLQLLTLGVTETGNLDRVGRGSLLEDVPWFFYIRRLLFVLAGETAMSIALFIAIAKLLNGKYQERARDTIFDFALVVWLPLIVATFYTLLTSRKYRDLWRERFLKKWGEQAGLGLVCNFELTELSPRLPENRKNAMKVLLNLQEIEPFRGMWLLPGGYINPSKGDESLHDTVRRRLGFLTDLPEDHFVVTEKDKLAAPVKIPQVQENKIFNIIAKLLLVRSWPAWLFANRRKRLAKGLSELAQQKSLKGNDFSIEYSTMVLRYGHAPTDTVLYCVSGPKGQAFNENEVVASGKSTLRWYSLSEIETTTKIPEHLRKLILLLISGEHSNNLWQLQPGRPHA